jgi:hypothetical protein
MQPLFDRHLPAYVADPGPEEGKQNSPQAKAHKNPKTEVTGVTTPAVETPSNGPTNGEGCNPCNPLLPLGVSNAERKDVDIQSDLENVTVVTAVTPEPLNDNIFTGRDPAGPRPQPHKKGKKSYLTTVIACAREGEREPIKNNTPPPPGVTGVTNATPLKTKNRNALTAKTQGLQGVTEVTTPSAAIFTNSQKSQQNEEHTSADSSNSPDRPDSPEDGEEW